MIGNLKNAANLHLLVPLMFGACFGLWLVGASNKTARGDATIVLENPLVRRVLERDNEVWRTSSLARADGSDEVALESDEFRILLMGGTKLSLDDYRSEDDPVIRKTGNGTVIQIAYVLREERHPAAPQSILVQYFLGEEPYLRKTLTLNMAEGQAVDRLEVERFRNRLVCDGGGIGQPIYIGDSWFVGLEYPGSFAEHSSGVVRLAHYPGLAKKSREKDGKWIIESKTAVAGVGLQGDPLDLAFSDYLETIRQPVPKHMLANTWIPDRNPGGPAGFRTKDYLDYFDLFDKNLAPYGIKLDSLQPDSGKFDHQSVSRPNQKFYPGGYGPLREQLETRGSSLSLWLGLNGWGNNVEWMTAQGYERANGPFDTFYCVSAPKINAAMHRTLKQTIEDGNISYFKHDFVQMMCSRAGHGHLPTFRHGFEANLDATLELMEYERQLKSDILCAPTSYVWHSPWWLMHANYLYMGISDYGSVSTWPQFSYREWKMNYRDDQFFRIYNQWRFPMPMSSMITHTFLPYEIGRAKGGARITAGVVRSECYGVWPRSAADRLLPGWEEINARVLEGIGRVCPLV